MEKIRELIYFDDYFDQFYEDQNPKVREKIDLGLYYLQYTKQIPSRYIGTTKTKNLYYLRIKQGSNIYRIFFCYDEGKIIVLFNGFQKKTQKTPKSEIKKALRIQKRYFDEKEK